MDLKEDIFWPVLLFFTGILDQQVFIEVKRPMYIQSPCVLIKGCVHLLFPQKLPKVNVNVIVHGKWVRNLEFYVLVQDDT